MLKFLKGTAGVLVIIIPLVIVLGLIFKHLTRKSFYPTQGETKIQGISSQVKIYFDDFGVPHIFADNENDMYFAMGYMHAQDRLWQMDIGRRVAEGRLSEILGSKVLEFDKLFRTIGINRFAYSWYNNISPKSKDILTAYTNGVNKFIETHQDNLSVEFDALCYKPEPWKPEESLMIGRLMGWQLNLGWYSDYVLGEIVNKVGIEKTQEIFPDTSIVLYKKPVTNDETDSTKKISSNDLNMENFGTAASLANGFFETYQEYRKFFDIDCTHSGSNSWVVSGDKSITGKPILANDPHLAFQAPSFWYEMQIKDKDSDVRGMSIAGLPGIIIGNNRSVAWGVTNLMNDDNDFIAMQKDSTSSGKYFYKNQSFSFDSLIEKIPVRDSEDVVYKIRLTKIGPVVSDLSVRGLASYNPPPEEGESQNKILSFKWTGFEYSDDIASFYKIDNAKNWDDFKEGLKDYGCPAMNFLYEDIYGNIAYHAAGKIPIRKTQTATSYIYPSNDDLDWTGFIDFDKMPNEYNPKQGYLLTANTNPFDWLKTDAKNRYYISYQWETDSRFDKIKEFLDSKTKLDVDDFKLIQMSYASPYAKDVSKYIVDAYKDNFTSDEKINWCLEKFKGWDGSMKPNESIGSVYNAFIAYLFKNLFEPQMGERTFYDFIVIQNIPYRSALKLLKQ